MTPEHQSANLASWPKIVLSIEGYPDRDGWTIWKPLALRFVHAGIEAGLDRYFRAGQSMHDLVFSTSEHHPEFEEARVIVVFHPPEKVRVTYVPEYSRFRADAPDYTLPYDEAFPTFCRFLSQLWSDTVPEPIPEEIRNLVRSLSPPILPRSSNTD